MAVERAWVSLGGLEIESAGDQRYVVITFRNSGRTAAKIVAVNISIRSSQQDASGLITDFADLPDTATYDPALFAPPAILVAGESSRMRVGVNEFDQMNAWRLSISAPGDDVKLWIYGYICYSDSLSPNTIRRYGWARKYDHVLTRRKGGGVFRFAHINKPQYNYAD